MIMIIVVVVIIIIAIIIMIIIIIIIIINSPFQPGDFSAGSTTELSLFIRMPVSNIFKKT